VPGLCFGADYNPEQWPEQVWAQDVALMREAGVTIVSVGIFAWALLEPAEGRYDFGWLDRVLHGLHEGGIAVDLATATASPPPWFSQAYPHTLPVDDRGTRLTYGSRQAYCPSSPRYREAAVRLVERLATRYAQHPALALWHVNNEYGCHVQRCYCDVSAEAFREWLLARYKDLDALNDAWGTAFWSQRYTDWAQVLPPRATPSFGNPTQALDFRRFSSDELLACYTAERDVLRRLTPGVPITTNLIPGSTSLDAWRWAGEMSVVSTDHYLIGESPVPGPAQIAYAADWSRSLAGGPWLLMEHSTSAVNWQRRNFAKPAGQLIRDSLGHVARGSDGALFFQWRASRAGAEKWHSAMVPHASTGSKIWRDVVTLGRHLGALSEVAGAPVDAKVALLQSYPSGWAQEAPGQPSADMTAFDEVRRWHQALWRMGITADLADPEGDLSPYPVVLVPALYLVTDAAAGNLADHVGRGGTLVVGPYSGLVDEHDRVRPAPLPGALADLLGVAIEEFFPLPQGTTVALDDGTEGRVWTEALAAVDADVLVRYADGPLPGAPAVTRNGTAWYLTTRLTEGSLEGLLARICAGAAVTPALPGAPPEIEAVRRTHADGRSYLFLFNNGEAAAQADAAGVDLLTGDSWPGPTTVRAGGAVVLRERRP
jgi:beta-galactosidase